MLRRIWWLMGVLSFLIIGLAGVYFFREEIGKKINWRTYSNVRYGYEIGLPSNWTSEAVEGAAEVFWSPDDKAYVAVQFIADPRLLEEDGEEKMDSFNPIAGRRGAIALVKKQKEVVEFERQLARLEKKANYGVEDDGDAQLV